MMYINDIVPYYIVLYMLSTADHGVDDVPSIITNIKRVNNIVLSILLMWVWITNILGIFFSY